MKKAMSIMIVLFAVALPVTVLGDFDYTYYPGSHFRRLDYIVTGSNEYKDNAVIVDDYPGAYSDVHFALLNKLNINK